MDGLAHLLSTGQGVVMERSPYTDIVFLEAMYRTNLISKAAYKGLMEIRGNSIHELMMPHLIIYLDVPINKTLVSLWSDVVVWHCFHTPANFQFFQFTLG